MAERFDAIKVSARSIRGRSTVLSVGVVLLALVVGSFVLLETYERRLLASLDATLEQQVADRVELIDRGGAKEALTAVLQDESFVWIGSTDGELTAFGGRMLPLENPVPDRVGRTTTVDLQVEEQYGSFEREQQTVRLASGVASNGQVVIAGSELEALDSTVDDLTGLFAIAVPLVAALVGLLSWITAGRALAPVGAIRSQAEEIGGSTLAERVPVPNSGDEIEALARTVNAMLERIEGHDVAIRQFSSDASHELKSPIANIQALVETRLMNDPAWHELSSQLSGETNRLSALVENLLFLATHQDADRLVDVTEVQLDELLFAEAELVSATSDVRVALGEVAPATVIGSAADLGRMVRNLVDNAARHATGRVELSLRSDGDMTELSVADDGPGIARGDRERIFERFTRLDEARTRGAGGTGLGLSIVRQIADAHGATVAVAESRLGGARFEVRWN